MTRDEWRRTRVEAKWDAIPDRIHVDQPLPFFNGPGPGFTLIGIGLFGLALLVGLTWAGHLLAGWISTAFV